MKTKQELVNSELLAFDRSSDKVAYRKALVTRKQSLDASIRKYKVELEAVEELMKLLHVKYGPILTD